MRRVFIAIALVAGVASADPFTGRYLIESQPDRGVSITGYIDFVGAPMGTTSFNLADASAFKIVASGPGLNTLVYSNTQGIVDADIPITFDAALGAAVLNPIGLNTAPFVRRWQGKGDLDGQGDGQDFIELRTANNSVTWFAIEDQGLANFSQGGNDTPPAAWRLVIPEPGAVLLTATGVALVAWRRRRTRSARSRAAS